MMLTADIPRRRGPIAVVGAAAVRYWACRQGKDLRGPTTPRCDSRRVRPSSLGEVARERRFTPTKY